MLMDVSRENCFVQQVPRTWNNNDKRTVQSVLALKLAQCLQIPFKLLSQNQRNVNQVHINVQYMITVYADLLSHINIISMWMRSHVTAPDIQFFLSRYSPPRPSLYRMYYNNPLLR